MNTITRMLIVGLATLITTCNENASKNDKFAAASPKMPSNFSRKKECAEIGFQYFQRSKTDAEEFAGKAQAGKWIRNGPLTTYSPERDSCLVAWTEFVIDKDVNGNYFQVHVGYLSDALTNEDLADFGYTKDAQGNMQNTGGMTEEQYERKVKELMGISPP